MQNCNRRLIDVDEAIEKINCLCVDDNENWVGTDNQSFVDHAEVIDILSDIPTVDAVEVVHGRWQEGHWGILLCPICNNEVKCEGWIINGKPNYCPNCGAKMDLEV